MSKFPKVEAGDIIEAVHGRRGTIKARVISQSLNGNMIEAEIIEGHWHYLAQEDEVVGDEIDISDCKDLCHVRVIQKGEKAHEPKGKKPDGA
jgi:hypothetical protein